MIDIFDNEIHPDPNIYNEEYSFDWPLTYEQAFNNLKIIKRNKKLIGKYWPLYILNQYFYFIEIDSNKSINNIDTLKIDDEIINLGIHKHFHPNDQSYINNIMEKYRDVDPRLQIVYATKRTGKH